MGKRKGPESQITSSVGDASQDKLDGLDELIHDHFLQRNLCLFLTLY
jgi:hypothetical protein